jgi:hypothetical protein
MGESLERQDIVKASGHQRIDKERRFFKNMTFFLKGFKKIRHFFVFSFQRRAVKLFVTLFA